MNDALSQVLSRRIIPVIVLDDPAAAGPLADALIAGGLPCAEITLRSPAALKALSAMAGRGDIVVGAGTVLSVDQARQARSAGAQYMVCPGFAPDVVTYCREAQIPVLPGVCTPTDIHLALNHGIHTVKYFPAEAVGGLHTLKALSGPFPMMRFVPTGGITAENLMRYLAHPNVAACGGSWIVARELIASGNFAAIRQRVSAAVAIAAQVGPSDS